MSSAIDSVLILLTGPGFLWAAGAGLVGLGLLFVVPPASRWWAATVAGATVVGLVAAGSGGVRPLVGILALGVGGHLIASAGAEPDGNRRPVGWAAVVVGSVVVSGGWGGVAPPWVGWAMPIVVVATGLAIAWWHDRPEFRWVGPMMAVSAGGLWAVVPDTESVAALVGAAGALALATVGEKVRLTQAGSFALAGLMAWLTVDGGVGRAGSIVGGWAVLGMLVLLPLGHAVLRRPVGIRSATLVVAHVVLAVVASRILGRWASAAAVLAAVIGLWVVVGALLVGVASVRQRRGPRPGVS